LVSALVEGCEQSMSWQEVMADEIVIARKELERSARRAWADLVRDLMPWDVVINAATFDTRTPDDPVGYTMTRRAAVKRFGSFFEKARWALGRPVEGFMACEVGPAGGLEHGHGLLALAGGLMMGDIKVLHDVWYDVRGNGTVKFQWPLEGDWFIEYTTKHTVKQASDVVFSVGCDRRHYQGWSAPLLAPGGTIDQVDRRTPHRSAAEVGGRP